MELTGTRYFTLVAVALALVGGGCGQVICPEFSPCSPRDGPEGAEKVVFSQVRQVPDGRSIYWLGTRYKTARSGLSTGSSGALDTILVSQSAGFAFKDGRAVPLPVQEGGTLVVLSIVTSLTDTPARRASGHSQLVLERLGDSGQSVAVYAAAIDPTASDAFKRAFYAALKTRLERDLQAVPRSLEQLRSLPGAPMG